MTKNVSIVIAISLAMSFVLANHAEAKSLKKSKKETAIAEQEAKKAKAESKKAKFDADAAEQKARERNAKKSK